MTEEQIIEKFNINYKKFIDAELKAELMNDAMLGEAVEGESLYERVLAKAYDKSLPHKDSALEKQLTEFMEKLESRIKELEKQVSRLKYPKRDSE